MPLQLSLNMQGNNSVPNALSSNSSKRKISPAYQVADHQHVCKKMATALDSGIMSDVTLLVGTARYPVHRVILCLASDVFQVMLTSSNFCESGKCEVRLEEDDCVKEVFPAMLRYVYTGDIVILPELVLPLLILADKYNINELSGICSLYMCERVVVACTHNLLVKWLKYSMSSQQHQLTEACLQFVRWNFECVASSLQFLELDLEVLVHLLQQDDLVVEDEKTLYHHAVRWLESREQYCSVQYCSVSSADGLPPLEQLIELVMLHIRFPMMSPRQLADLLLVPITSRHKSFFVERIAIGMYFHSGEWTRVRECLRTGEVSGALLEPRLYTDEQWSAGLCVERYSCLSPYSTRTLVFQSPAQHSEWRPRRPLVEWVVDVYPRGVWFRKCYLIVWEGKTEVPEAVLPTVRASFMPRAVPDGVLRVRLAVLVDGLTDGVRHVRTVHTRVWVFTDAERRVNFDDLLSLAELGGDDSPHLLGASRDQLCLRVIAVPLDDINREAAL